MMMFTVVVFPVWVLRKFWKSDRREHCLRSDQHCSKIERKEFHTALPLDLHRLCTLVDFYSSDHKVAFLLHH